MGYEPKPEDPTVEKRQRKQHTEETLTFAERQHRRLEAAQRRYEQ